MAYNELIGVKKNFGYGTSLLDITATAYVGQSVSVKDIEGNTIASKPIPIGGRVKIPVEDTGILSVSTPGAMDAIINITTYGTYKVTLTDRVVYTIKIAINNSDPRSRCSYEDDAEGFTPAGMDFNTGRWDYGSWENAFFMPKPCMVGSDGTIDYFLDPDDYTKKEDGTPSDIANTSYDGNVFVAVPTVYLKYSEDDTYRYIHVSDKAGDGYQCYAHHDQNENIMPYTFWPAYNGSLIDGKLRSLSGQTPLTNATAANERTYARANDGQGTSSIYDIETFADRMLFIALCTLIGKSTDTQTVFGTGRCSANNDNAIATGSMNDKGLFWGSNDQVSGVKVFGVENPWGNVWRRIVGLLVSGTKVYIKMTKGTEDGSAVTDYSPTAVSGYISAGVTMSGTSGGYINTCNTTEYGIIPKTASGSETTYECDGLWFNTSSGTYMALVGGGWSRTGRVGAWCVNLGAAASVADSDFGASLSCKPPVV